jgi:predicted porin
MKQLKLRPSSASRWIACPASARLSTLVPYQESGEAAKIGTAIHALAETCFQLDTDPMKFVGQQVEGITMTEENCEFALEHLQAIWAIQDELGHVKVEQLFKLYDTPAFSGFSASVNYAPGNKDATAQTATLAAAPQVTDIGLAYSNGPLNVNYSNLKRSAVVAASVAAQADGTASFGLAAVSATEASTYQSLGANYTMGAFKLLAGYGKGEKSAASNADSKLSTLGASYTFGANTILAAKTKTTLGTAAAREATGVRYDRALSKRTVAYVVHEAYDSGATSANKTNITAVGVRHAF